MGFEFKGKLEPALTDDRVENVLGCVKKIPALIVVRDEPNSLGLRYADAVRSSESEQLAITLSRQDIYVVFHVGTRQQRERVIQAIRAAFDALAITGELEEE